MKEFLTKNFLGIAVLVIGVLLYLQRCKTEAVSTPPPKIETKTEYIVQPPIQVPMYIPQPSQTQAPIIIPPNYQPSKDLETLVKQYEQLAQKFLEVKTYKDSIKLVDSTGANVGVVNLTDIVSENELKSRNPSYQLSFPHTTTTITKYYPPKNQVYIGATALGNENQLVSGAQIGLYLKNKRDQLYNVQIQKQANTPITYGVGMSWKIKLNKK